MLRETFSVSLATLCSLLVVLKDEQKVRATSAGIDKRTKIGAALPLYHDFEIRHEQDLRCGSLGAVGAEQPAVVLFYPGGNEKK